jgi:hypothetical protein
VYGSVTVVDTTNNDFTIVHNGNATTIQVNPSTQWTGTATNLGQVQVGWHATVVGQSAGGTVTAISVDANPNTDT